MANIRTTEEKIAECENVAGELIQNEAQGEIRLENKWRGWTDSCSFPFLLSTIIKKSQKVLTSKHSKSIAFLKKEKGIIRFIILFKYTSPFLELFHTKAFMLTLNLKFTF